MSTEITAAELEQAQNATESLGNINANMVNEKADAKVYRALLAAYKTKHPEVRRVESQNHICTFKRDNPALRSDIHLSDAELVARVKKSHPDCIIEAVNTELLRATCSEDELNAIGYFYTDPKQLPQVKPK